MIRIVENCSIKVNYKIKAEEVKCKKLNKMYIINLQFAESLNHHHNLMRKLWCYTRLFKFLYIRLIHKNMQIHLLSISKIEECDIEIGTLITAVEHN